MLIPSCIWSARFDHYKIGILFEKLLAVTRPENIAFQLNNCTFLLCEQSLRKATDGDDADHALFFEHWQVAHMIFAHQFSTLFQRSFRLDQDHLAGHYIRNHRISCRPALHFALARVITLREDSNDLSSSVTRTAPV